MKNFVMYRINMIFAKVSIAMLYSEYVPLSVLQYTLRLQHAMNNFFAYDWSKA